MAITRTSLPDSHGRRRPQRLLQFFLHNRINQQPRPLPNRHLETSTPGCGLSFYSLLVLGILRHRVILRHPPPSGRISWLKLRWMMTRSLLFHQTQDTTSYDEVTHW